MSSRRRQYGVPAGDVPFAHDDTDIELTGPFGNTGPGLRTPPPAPPKRSFSVSSPSPKGASPLSPSIPASVSVTPLTLDALLDHPYLNAITAQDTSFLRQPTVANSSPSPSPSPSSSMLGNIPETSAGITASPSAASAAPAAAGGRGPSRMWIQVSNLVPTQESAEVLRLIGQHFRIHPVTITDLQPEEDTREKLEVFPHYLFLVVRAAIHPTPTIFDIVTQEAEELRAAKSAEQAGVLRQRRNLPANEPDKAPLQFGEDENPFEVPPAARRSLQRQGSMPRVLSESELKRGRTGIFRAAGLNTSPIQLVVFPNLVISFHHGIHQGEINSICRRLDHFDETRMADTGQWIVHAMLEAVTSSLRPIVDEVEKEVDMTEELIYSLEGSMYADLLKRMGLTRRRLVILKQQLKSKQSILSSLIGRDWQAVVSSVQNLPYLRDVFDHVDTMLVKVDCASEVLTALQDSYLSSVQLRSETMSRDVNQLMKKFSAFATIILPLSLISGIMGMNVEVPSQVWQPAEDGASINSQHAFWTIIAVMIIIGGSGLIFFKRKGYL